MAHSDVTVIGGGIAGLAAALALQDAGRDVSIYEASSRWGGKIKSSLVGDTMVDAGPDSFLARAQPTIDLCERLGLTSQLTTPVAKVPAYIYREGKLYELPKKTLVGFPVDADAVAASGLVSDQAVAMVRNEPTLPAHENSVETIGGYCRQRFGDEITDYLIDPLVGGINASNVDTLCLHSALPLLQESLRHSHSLVFGMRQVLEKRRKESSSILGGLDTDARKRKPTFYSFSTGIASFIEALVTELHKSKMHLETPHEPIHPRDSNRYVIATPAYGAAELLKSTNPKASELLTQIRYASVAQVTLAFPKKSVTPLLDTSGIVFPRADNMLLSACTWLSSKWNHYATDDSILLRLTTGRYGNDSHTAALSNDELTTTLLKDIQQVLTIHADPTAVRVQRWPRSFPQYEPGHNKLVAEIRQSLQHKTPNITLAGAAYDGIGIPACVHSGIEAA